MANIVLQDVATSSRVHRRPKHKFYINTYPYTITPFMISAVWPGESLVNAWFEGREVSAPLANSITGWGSEWYLFYCRMSDLVAYPAVMDMLINPTNAPLTGAGPAYDNNLFYYHTGPHPNYLYMCTERIVETYFRDVEETTAPAGKSTGSFMAKFHDQGVFDSVTPETIDDMVVPPAASGMDDLARAQDLYDYLVAAQLTDLTYSDWCAAYGVKIPKEEKQEPELLLQFKEWVYPSNTVDPLTGSPSSALSLVVKKSFNEARYFKEPGFLVGLHVLRPKLYIGEQLKGSAAFLNTALAWLPAMLSSDPSTSLREFAGSEIIVGGGAEKYILDMRDLPMYGDQFVHGDPPEANMQIALGMQYPDPANLPALFKDPLKTDTLADGFINLDIVGRIVDYTTAHTSQG